MTARFWLCMVDSISDDRPMPRVRHRTLQEARAEAERLARVCPGVKVYILEPIAACIYEEKPVMRWVNVEGADART